MIRADATGIDDRKGLCRRPDESDLVALGAERFYCLDQIMQDLFGLKFKINIGLCLIEANFFFTIVLVLPSHLH